MVEYVTKKIPKTASRLISRLQAKLSLRGEKVTEGQVIALGLAKLDEDLEMKKRHSIAVLNGLEKGKAISSESEIDEILYGD